MRFVVREIVKDDLPVLYKFVTDKEIAYLTDYDSNITYDEFLNTYDLYFNNKSENLKIFAIVLDNKVVGKIEIGYDLENKNGIFDIIIGEKELWGKGIATKALNVLFSFGFNNLGLNRISCEIYSFNARSIYLMRKMNLQVDGLLREAQFLHNKFVDIYIFSILRREFLGGE